MIWEVNKVPMLYKIVRPIIKILFMTIYHPKVIGKDHIIKEDGVIYAGNHTNYFDCLLLISLNTRVVHFLAKHTLLKGIKGPIFRGMQIIPVDRTKSNNKEATESAIKVLNKNGVVGIFPEGTINKTSDVIMPFKMGAVSMAKKTDSWIVPFAIKGKYRPFINDLTIEFSTPYKVESDNLEKENQKLMKEVKKMLERK